MKQIDLTIEGMSCGHCVARVSDTLKGVQGVQQVSVSLEDNRARVDAEDDFDPSAAVSALTEAGYPASAV